MSKILPSVVVYFVILWHIYGSYAVKRSPRPDLEKHDFYFDDKVSPSYKSPAESSNQKNNNTTEVDSSETIREPEKSEIRENVTQESLDSDSDPEDIANWELKKLLQYFVTLLHSVKGNNSRYKEKYARVRNEGTPNPQRNKEKMTGPHNTKRKHKNGDGNELDLKLENSSRRFETGKDLSNDDKNSRLKVTGDRKTNVNTKPELQNQESEPQGKIKNIMTPNAFESKNTSINNSPMKSDHVSSEFIDDYINYSPRNVTTENETSINTKTSSPNKTKYEMNRKLNDPLTFKNFSRLKLNNGPVSMNETTDRNNKGNLTKIPYQQYIHQHIIPKVVSSNQPKQASLNEESKIPIYSNNNKNKDTMHNQPNYTFNTNPQSQVHSPVDNTQSLQFKNNNYMGKNIDAPETMERADKLEERQQIKPPNFKSLPEKHFDDQAEQNRYFNVDLSPAKTKFKRYRPKTEYTSKLGNIEKPNNSFLSPSHQNKVFIINPNNPNPFYNNTNSPDEMKLAQSKDKSNQNAPRNILDKSSENFFLLHDSLKSPPTNENEQLTPETKVLPQEKSSKIYEVIPSYTFNNPDDITNLEKNNPEEETAQNDPNLFIDMKLNQTKDMPNQNGHRNVLDRKPENSPILDDSTRNPSKNENKQLRPETDLPPKEESSKIDKRIPQHTFNSTENINFNRNNNPIEETDQNNPHLPMETKLTQAKYMSNQNASRNVLDRNPENSTVLDDSPKYSSMKENKQLNPEIDFQPPEESSKIDEQIHRHAFSNPEDRTNLERNNNPKEETVQNSPNPPTETKLIQAKDMSNKNVPRNVLDSPENSSVLDKSQKYTPTNRNKQLRRETDLLPQDKSPKIDEQILENSFNNPEDKTNLERDKPEEGTTKIDRTESEISSTDSPNIVTATGQSSVTFDNYSFPSEREISTLPSEYESENTESDESSDSYELEEEDGDDDEDEVQMISNFKDSGEFENKSPQMSQISSEPLTNNSMKMELPKNVSNENRDNNVLPSQETDTGEVVEKQPSQLPQISSEPFTNKSMKMELPKHFSDENKDNDDLPTQGIDSGEGVENKPPQMSQISSEPFSNNSMTMELPKNFTNENRDNDDLPTQGKDSEEVENQPSQIPQNSSEPIADNSRKMELPKNFADENGDNDDLPTQETDSGGNIQSETSQMSQISSEPHRKNSVKTETPITLEKETKCNDTLLTKGKYNTILEFLYRHSNNPAFTNMKALRNIAYE